MKTSATSHAPSAAPYLPRCLRLRDGREVTLRAVEPTDAAEIIQAFERLSVDARYNRFMQHKKQLNAEALERSVNPQPGHDFVLVATIPAPDGIDIVGAAQYLRAEVNNPSVCEFSITVAKEWRGTGLATELLASLLRRAPSDGYTTMEGSVMAANTPMRALARKLGFEIEHVPEDATVVHVTHALEPEKVPPERPPEPVNRVANTAATPPPSAQ